MIIIVIIIIIFPVITETSFHTPDAVGQHNKECGWPLVYHWDRAKKTKTNNNKNSNLHYYYILINRMGVVSDHHVTSYPSSSGLTYSLRYIGFSFLRNT